ncbi:MAG TPA: hypothetical protein VM056_04710 [Terriglobales bacterium]|nr:hypothetical protein [Terriglobales bacterium]
MTLTPKARQCPDCDSTQVRRSMPMSWRERNLLPKLLIRVYRCEDCGMRFYGFRFFRRLAVSAAY